MTFGATVWAALLLSEAVTHAAPCVPRGPVEVAELVQRLDAPLDPSQPFAYQQRLGDIQLLRACPDPEAAPALFRVFLRSRYGTRSLAPRRSGLPEDPDLFEAALRALALLPAPVVAAAAEEGLGWGLTHLVAERLREDWLRPAIAHLPASVQRDVEEWPASLPQVAALEQLVHLVQEQPYESLRAMSVDGGSLAQQAVQPLEDALLADLLLTSTPELAEAVAHAIQAGGFQGPHLTTALSQRAADLPPTVATAVGHPGLWPEVALPPVPPGRLPGREAVSPTAAPETFVTWNTQPHFALSGFGVGLAALPLLGAAFVGRRKWPRVSAVALGIGGVFVLDAGLDLSGFAPPPSEHPLFSFVASAGAEAHPVADDPRRVWLGGGSMRHQIWTTTPTAAEPPRVAFLGASTVHGSHYPQEEAFPARVAAQLSDRAPISALNLGIGGTTSAGVEAAGHTALQLGAQGIVIVYGHNEAAQFARLAQFEGTDAHTLRLRLLAARSALFRVLRRQLPSNATPRQDAMRTRTTPPTPADIAALTGLAVTHLQLHLGRLLTAANAANVPVVLVVPPTNLRFAHLESFPGDNLDDLRRRADAAADSGDAALARTLLQTAIDQSASPREIVTPIRTALYALGRQHGVPVVDAQGWFCAHAPDGVTPSGLFWDDLHPTAQGHETLATLLAPVVATMLERAR